MHETVIMWVDDEIEFLTPHIRFLEERGFQVLQFTNGHDAIEEFETNHQIRKQFFQSLVFQMGNETNRY